MNKTTTLLEQAKTLYSEGKLAESEAAFERLIASGSDVAEGFYGVGLVRGSMQDWDAAVASFEKALEHDPRHANAFYQLGFLTEQRGDLQEATDYYQKALSANPRHQSARVRLGPLSNLQLRPSFLTANGSSSQAHPQGPKTSERGATPHIVVEGSETAIPGTRLPLVGKETTTLGRSSDNDIALENEDSVSRRTDDGATAARGTRNGASLNPESGRSRRIDGGMVAQPPAAGDVEPRPPLERSPRRFSALWRATLAGDAMVGVVRGLRARSEPDYPYNFFPWQIWTFSVEREDEAGNRLPPILVEMRGHEFTGFIEDGDEVEIPGTWRPGEVKHAKEVYNLTKNATVRATERRASRIQRMFTSHVMWVIKGVFRVARGTIRLVVGLAFLALVLYLMWSALEFTCNTFPGIGPATELCELFYY